VKEDGFARPLSFNDFRLPIFDFRFSSKLQSTIVGQESTIFPMSSAASPHSSGLPFALAERVIQTHANIVVLIGDKAYKLKKPVKFPFLDYSTLELRKHFVSEEVRLNRRFSPDYYLGVCEVFEQGGALHFGTALAGKAIDHALIMKRIPDEAWLPALMKSGNVPEKGIHALVQRLVDAFSQVTPTPEVEAAGLPQNLAKNTVANIAECERYVGRCLTREQFTRLDDLLHHWFESHPHEFMPRVTQGRIRDGHGDLKPGNIAFIDGQPVITDCIEFGTQWRYLDTLAEMAFLATGLESLGQFALAQQVFEHYRVAAKDEYRQELRRYYQVHFACVMAKVTALQLDAPEVPPEAKARAKKLASQYFALADFHAREPHLIVVAGIMGCGKTTLAAELAGRLGWPHLSSDPIRKELSGVSPTARLPQSAYAAEMTQRVYATLLERAGNSHVGAVIDAQFGKRSERESLRKSFLRAQLVLCDAPDAIVRERMNRREQDPGRISDATADLLEQARRNFEPIADAEGLNEIRIDTRESVEASADRVIAKLSGES
jgi:aminoglycoside phosphotransferase family enzyme/predicted kinase